MPKDIERLAQEHAALHTQVANLTKDKFANPLDLSELKRKKCRTKTQIAELSRMQPPLSMMSA
jgi:hypothetical protein